MGNSLIDLKIFSHYWRAIHRFEEQLVLEYIWFLN
jgi:hypothetical protein